MLIHIVRQRFIMVISITNKQRQALYAVDRNTVKVGNHYELFHTRTLNCLLKKKLIEIDENVYKKTEWGRIVLAYNISHNINLDLTWLKNAYKERGVNVA